MLKYFQKVSCVVLAVLLLCGASSSEEDRRIEEQKRSNLKSSEATLPGLIDEDGLKEGELAKPLHEEEHTVGSKVTWDVGGWINYRYADFHNSDNDKSTEDSFDHSSSVDTRVWLRGALILDPEHDPDREHQLYIRLKDLQVDYDGVDGIDSSDHNGPHVDYAYTILDFSPIHVEAGRRYFSVGRGLAYSDVNDGVQINYLRPGWNIGLFAAHTLPHERNIDASVPGGLKDSDRWFTGLGIGYTRWEDHQVYGFTVLQRDFSDEDPVDADQQYTYDSEVYGIGAVGWLNELTRYWLEGIAQTGQSHVFGSNEKRDVRSWAADVGVEYFADGFPLRTALQYAFGSGDADREDVTDTEFGNTNGNDHNFLYFGYAPTGYALSPRLSNLHMLRLGFVLTPFEDNRFLENLSVGADYFRFWKHRAGGAISDLQASVADRDIGQEVDLTLDWTITEAVILSIEYGLFFPGDAYDDSADDREQYMGVSLSYSF